MISWDALSSWGATPAPGVPNRYGVQSTIGPTGITYDFLAAFGAGSGPAPTWNIKRRSTAMHLLLNTIPAGDGSISQAERQDVIWCYAGILVGAVAAFPRRTANMMLLLNTLPPGDGTISQADRQDIAWHYGGILAGAAPVGAGKLIPEDLFDMSVI